jgi:AraC-like DNA-binding protein
MACALAKATFVTLTANVRSSMRETMQAPLSPMRSADSVIKAGAFSSDGLEIETPWHFHDLHQLLYAIEDSVEVESQFARYKVPHQFAAWIPAGTIHRTAIKKVRSGSVFLSTDMLDLPVNSVRVIPVSNLMREMVIEAMRWPIDGNDDDFSRTYFNCFAKLSSEWVRREVTLVLPSSDDPRINTIIKCTRENLQNVTLQDVCRDVGMSERSLRRHFQKAMGISWEDFRLRLRMYTAIDYLDSSRKPIGAIAAEVGYTSQAAFARAFKVIMGIGPTAYRRAQH